MVVWSHTVREGLGNYGVKIFFVLSGFLITGILLRQRDRGGPLAGALRTFYVRRSLRIFPVYYVLLAVLVAVNVPGVRNDLGWHALYLSNWMMAARGVWPTAAGHLWSLSVEEQFYLVWPVLLLAVPTRGLAPALWCAVAVGVLSRLVLPFLTANLVTLNTPTVVSLDALAAGGLLALYRRPPRGAVWVGLAVLAVSVTLMAVGRGFKLVQLLDPLGITLVALWAVDGCVRGFRGWWGALLAAAPVQWVGRVSYGVYLVHLPVVWALQSRGWSAGLALFAATLTVTLALAALSWYALERPMKALKDRVVDRPAGYGWAARSSASR